MVNLIVSKNQPEAMQVSDMLAEQNFASDILPSLERLSSRLEAGDVMATIIDIDTISVDNRDIRQLTLEHPSVCFFCISRDKFHPELKDAICYHIYACLNKPIDPDELKFLMDSIEKEVESSERKEARWPPTPTV